MAVIAFGIDVSNLMFLKIDSKRETGSKRNSVTSVNRQTMRR